MDIVNIPRKYLLGLVVVMIVILVTVITTNPGTLKFQDDTDYEAQKLVAANEARQYQALLDSLQPDYQSSQQMLKKIATEDLVRQEVQSALYTNQRVNIPTVATADLTLNNRTDKAAVVDYLNRLGSVLSNYNQQAEAGVNQTFADNPDSAQISSAERKTKELSQSLRGLAVPTDAVEMHKAYIVTYDTFGSFLDIAGNYATGTNTDPWPSVYGQYATIDNQLGVANSQFLKISEKFALGPDDFNKVERGLSLIKPAQAQFGVGITTVIDIKAAAEVGIRAGLARSFARFATTMLDKLVAHIEKSFAIASQLYYSQDLGRYYSVEYMKKFVSDPAEQDIIQKFLPEYFCTNQSKDELKKIFTAKARVNQGTDIIIDPSDPQFLNKLAKLGGDEKNYEGWWEDYYSSLASETQQAAEAAATKEVLSPGLKSGRDLVNGQINKTMAAIFNTQEAAIAGTINLGTNNADNAVSQLVAGIVENMVNKFIFTAIGAGSSSSGGIAVIQEQNVCLKVPQIKPIAAIGQTGYESPN